MKSKVARSQPLVGVVTPLYNNAEYLADCIESILSQTHQNWDYVIVDNCSEDGSIDIARRYAAKDSRIRVIQNKEFLPIICNHNRALRHLSSASKSCKMVFADDWIFSECLEQLVEVAEEYPSVGIVGAYGLQGNEVVWTGLPYPSRCISGREVCRRRFLEGLFVFGAATALLFRADLIRKQHSFYNESNLHADMEACVALLKIWDFGFVHQVLCFSRVRPGSTSDTASDMTTYKTAFLYDLVIHGPDFLAPGEYEECRRRVVDDYYNFLAVSFFFRRDRTFWEYHMKQLAVAGVGLSKTRLATAILARLCRASLNPMETVHKLLKSRADLDARRKQDLELPLSRKSIRTA